MVRTRSASRREVFLMCAVTLATVGCGRCGSERLHEVEECQVAANHERPETCNGKDDDCDGKIDLADPTFDDARIGTTCNDGTLPPQLAGIGSCELGENVCGVDGGVRCAGTVGPQAETCNGKDDDCNGQTDEGPANYQLCWSPRIRSSASATWATTSAGTDVSTRASA